MADVVRFRTPMGDEITIKLIDHGNRGVLFEPISANARGVHHHAFEANGDWNILIRDQNNQNIAAFVLNKRTGQWTQRPLTSAEKRNR